MRLGGRWCSIYFFICKTYAFKVNLCNTDYINSYDLLMDSGYFYYINTVPKICQFVMRQLFLDENTSTMCVKCSWRLSVCDAVYS